MKLKHLVPPTARRFLRETAADLPHRLRDARADLGGRRAGGLRLPPASFRRRVANNSSRQEFLAVGERIAEDVLAAASIGRSGEPGVASVLDFGCGCGRLARHLPGTFPGASITGVDIDAPAVDWCVRNLPGTYLVGSPSPPLPLPDRAFDLIIAISVFTHLSEAGQNAWLAELARLLTSDGRLVVSTHNPDLAYLRPDLAASHGELERSGFLFGVGHGAFNEDTAFHSEEYMRRAWAPWFTLVEHRHHGLNGFQDLSAWRPNAAGGDGAPNSA